MAYAAKAYTKGSVRRSAKITAFLFSALGLLSIIMLIYSLIVGKVLFAVAWIIAAILCITYVVIRVNAVFSTYLAADKKNVYMKTWSNGFLPFKADSRIKILSEFIPASTRLIEIPIEDISSVIIGNKNFIKRTGEDNENFTAAIRPYETSKDITHRRSVNSMEYFYISAVDGECYFMPITKFAPREVTRVLQYIQRANPDAQLKVSSREFRTSLKEKR
ncbi:MAG: hypothetical protein PUF72_11325 [Clostridiales bacterium]|nr:hypothetical protein [Clostridiales bacterium]